MDQRQIFAFLKTRLEAEQSCILASIVHVDGSSMRGPGAHIAIAGDRSFIGSLSGGCIEQAVFAEAIETLEKDRPRITRFGAGSRYIDIKLPCGGGLDIHFMPLHDASAACQCFNAIRGRQAFSIILPEASGEMQFENQWQPIRRCNVSGTIAIGHWPAPRLLIIGHGAAVKSLANLAVTTGYEVKILTSDPKLAAELEQTGEHKVSHLKTPKCVADIESDPWTAVVFLFHDHDWEGDLMAHALSKPHFYIGAMGGRKAHIFRKSALQKLGVTADDIDSIHAPIGLFHSVRDPDTLALSILAQVAQSYHNTDFAQ